MHFIKLFGKLFLGALLFSTLSLTVSARENETYYKLTVDANSPRLLKIEAGFVLKDNLLYMNEAGAEQFPKRWASFVQNIRVRNSRGNLLALEELPNARWKINTHSRQRITLSYEIRLRHDDYEWPGGIDGIAFARDWGVFYTGRTFLILNGRQRSNIKVGFRLPADWHVSVPWQPLRNNVFSATNLSDLTDSMFFAGTHQEISVKRNNFELIFALGESPITARSESYKNLAQGVLGYYIRLMGGIPHPPPANRFKRSLVIINAGQTVDGEVIGNHISLILNPDGPRQTQLLAKFIFAHEFFHFWNGKSIRVADTTEDWFKEGVTNYYALKALLQTGEMTEEEYFETLSNLFYQRYSIDSGLNTLSMRDAASGAAKDEHWGLIYGGGLFVGICQDIAIRRESRNRLSLDNLMRDYFKRYGGTNKTYTTADLQKSLTVLSGKDQTEFFKEFVFGAKKVPIEQCLSSAGLNIQIENDELRIIKKASPSQLEEAILNGILGK